MERHYYTAWIHKYKDTHKLILIRLHRNQKEVVRKRYIGMPVANKVHDINAAPSHITMHPYISSRKPNLQRYLLLPG